VKPLPLPRVVDAKSEPGAGEALVVPSFERGAALLRGADGNLVRLSWEDEDARTDPERALAVGRYTLVGYRLLARDPEHETWHVSASAVKGVELDVQPGRTNTLEIDPTIQIVARKQGEGLGVSVQGAGGAGLSIYAEGKRIPLGFRRLDAQGRTLAEGKIQYG